MRAVVYRGYGTSDVLEQTDLPLPVAAEGQVLVRVATSGVNPVDVMVRKGLLPHLPALFPVVPGWDLAGLVEAVGEGVTGFAVGDRVLGTTMGSTDQRGTSAELVAVNPDELAPLPDGVSWQQAAALPLVGLTAAQVLRAAQLSPGETVLVHRAAGGVGHVLIQLAALAGARVIGTASPENHALLTELGAIPVTYGPGLVDRVRAITPDGVDVVLDLGGGPDGATTVGTGRDGARLVSIVQPAVAESGGIYVSVGPDPDELRHLVGLLASGDLKVLVTRTFALDEIAAAHDLVESGHAKQKVVVTVADLS